MVSRYSEPLLCTRYGKPIRSIALTPARNQETYKAAAELALRAVHALGLTAAVFHLEVFGEPGQFVASELACRPGGGIVGVMTERVIGMDIYEASARVITGDPIPRWGEETEYTHGWTILPTAPGKLNAIDPEEIMKLPGVDSVIMRLKKGSHMRDMADASTTCVGRAAVKGTTPIFWHEQMESWVLTRYRDCREVLRDYRLSARDRRCVGEEVPEFRQSIQSLDPPA
ncbi:hypothetical protein [Streptomyces lydicus]|uniref:hypothetical protein n=1 Tax=Streptomyces lydicus TaxID=47763 RepID=UPI0036E725C7